MNVVNVKKLVKSYDGKKVIDNVSFSICAGEIFVVLGPNGAGKSTILESVAGILPYDKGEIELFGNGHINRRNIERIGYQIENSTFDKNLKVKEILIFFSSFYKKKASIDEIYSITGLEERKDEFFGKLSLGWKQRVQIAVALIHDPDLIIFDELTLGLDVESKRKILDFIIDLKIKKKKTVLLVTNDIYEAEYLADSLLFLINGKCIRKGNINEFRENPVSRYVVECDMGTVDMVPDHAVVDKIDVGNKKLVYVNGSIDDHIKPLIDKNVSVRKSTLEDVYLYFSNTTSKGRVSV